MSDTNTTATTPTINETPIGVVTKLNNQYCLINIEHFTDVEKANIMAMFENHLNEGGSITGNADELCVRDIV